MLTIDYCNVHRNAEFDFSFEKLKDINPSMVTRPERDGAWVETQWKKIRSDISQTHSGFHQSGNQDAENLHEEWAKSASYYQMADHIVYSDLLIDDDRREGFGKKAAKAHGKDSCVTGEPVNSSDVSTLYMHKKLSNCDI
jgi:hypothetical protein